ncbi:MAG TPA: hypothetical protein VFH51_01900, partial [Myxococcota bacterium]|nr:hypothetical protein [Myxococcota bacterium]
MKAILLTLLVIAPAVAWADDGGGAPLVCVGTDTFFPRGDHWATAPGAAVPLRFQPDGPTQAPPNDVPGALANGAVERAFGRWAAASCPTPPGSRPNVRFTPGPPQPTRDRGDDPANGVYSNVIYWVVTPGSWPADSATVALTTNSYTEATYYTINGDM